jgi:carbon-monoxide dehydrogenase iron sulfur subunit
VFEVPAPKPRIHAEPGLALNTAFPNKCRHCNPAPCQAACPTGAIQRDKTYNEIVLVQARKCIACGMCAMVCPFDVITFYASAAAPEKHSVAIKCDQCIERQRQGLVPACVEACKVGALEFGEINELVKAARTQYSAVVSVAVGQVSPEIVALPANIEAWRNWGAAVENLNTNGKKGA